MANSSRQQNCCLRIPDEMRLQINSRAALEGCTPSELIKGAITEYLTKDINIQAQELGVLEALRGQLNFLDKKTELLSSLWLFWLKYYFALTKGFGDIPQEVIDEQFKKGEYRKNMMIKDYKEKMKKQPSFLETLLADYLGKEVRE
jgi:hypothetical protein